MECVNIHLKEGMMLEDIKMLFMDMISLKQTFRRRRLGVNFMEDNENIVEKIKSSASSMKLTPKSSHFESKLHHVT